MSVNGEEDPMDLGEDDLFGDDDGEEEVTEKVRVLDDEELDSGDDEARHDRDGDRMEVEEDAVSDSERPEQSVIYNEIPKHQTPKPSDGEINILRVPNFLAIAPKAYDQTTYKIPVADHHSHTKSENFSACETATTTIRYRKNPETGKLESNTLIYKWSDGSTTIQVGDKHYEIEAKQLKPPKNVPYKPEFDSNTYLATGVSSGAFLLQVVGHMSNSLTVRPNKDLQDDALEILQNSMALATRGKNNGKSNIIEINEDPELQKKQAEAAEKERMKLQRRRENATIRATQQQGSRGTRITTASGGLSIGDLEGRSGTKKATKSRPRRSRYDESDEDRPRRGGREDEYDLEDDFLASSDDEEEAPGQDDDDEDEEMIDDDSGDDEPKSRKATNDREDVSDADADGEVDPDVPAAVTPAETHRGKRRNVIEDDDDE